MPRKENKKSTKVENKNKNKTTNNEQNESSHPPTLHRGTKEEKEQQEQQRQESCRPPNPAPMCGFVGTPGGPQVIGGPSSSAATDYVSAPNSACISTAAGSSGQAG